MLVIDVGALLVLPMIVLLSTQSVVLTMIVFLFVLVFMYSPDKESSLKYDSKYFYSPSAGYVRSITDVNEHIRVSLFLNVFDNHTQYFPVDSKIVSTTEKSGLFEPAYNEHSINNQKVIYTIQSTKHKFEYTVTQITGLLTRRIIRLAPQNVKVHTTGSRLGFIMFGSRVDVMIPKKWVKRMLVKEGDHIEAMEEIIEINTQ